MLLKLRIKLNRTDQEGMTLIEVLVALVLLCLVTTTILAIFVPGALWLQKAKQETTAVKYAFAILEDIRSRRGDIKLENFAQSEEEWENNLAIVPGDLGLNQSYKPKQMTAGIIIIPHPDSDYLYKVKVIVNWQEGANLRNLSLITIIRADPGGN